MTYIRGNSMPRANLAVLDKLISARHELAEIMGYRSYAEFTLKCNMASSAEVVMSFLLKMSNMVRPKADKVVALVCNFPGSCNPSAVRLNHSEVETLFHEFGHALHSLLSRTDYQHFSGTRVALELAETTSNLFEYYAWDYRVLKTFARHYSTGEEIPQKLVESLQGARKMFAATDLQRQIFYALCDQKLFGEQPPTSNTSSIVAALKREHTSWEHIDGTNWQTRFTHLLNYGAGYYSYLYAKCFAATIWEKLCQDDPLSMTAGTALRTKFLQHGGAKDPEALLNGLVGGGIVRYHNGGIIPNIESLSREMNLGTSY